MLRWMKPILVVLKRINIPTREQPIHREEIQKPKFPFYQPCNAIGKDYKEHNVVDHGIGEYVRGKAHTNNAEGFFSQLKRSLSGTFHHVSDKHLDRYLAEFDYRYNTRKIEDGSRMKIAIKKSGGKRLSYKGLIGK